MGYSAAGGMAPTNPAQRNSLWHRAIYELNSAPYKWREADTVSSRIDLKFQ